MKGKIATAKAQKGSERRRKKIRTKMTSNMEKGEAAKGKIKISLIVLEILIAVGILAVPLVRFGRLTRFIDFSTPAWVRHG